MKYVVHDTRIAFFQKPASDEYAFSARVFNVPATSASDQSYLDRRLADAFREVKNDYSFHEIMSSYATNFSEGNCMVFVTGRFTTA